MTRLGRTELEDIHPEDWESLDHQVIAALIEDLAREHDPATLHRRLLALRPVLGEHFRSEEVPGGFFDDLVRQAPGRAADVAALRAEHAEILTQVRELLSELEAVQGAQDQLQEAKARLVHRLRQHHDAEERLLLDVVLRER